MACHCSGLPEAFYLDEAPKGFAAGLDLLDTRNWLRLQTCPVCGAFWVIDEWEKYSHQVASRMTNPDDWLTPLPVEQRKRLLLEARGGITTQTCAWAGCTQKRVKGVAYCIDHLFTTGARR